MLSRSVGDGVEIGRVFLGAGEEEDGVGQGADGELRTDKKKGQTETCAGVGGVVEAGPVKEARFRVGVSQGGVRDVDGPCSEQSTQSQDHRELERIEGLDDRIWR